MLLVLMLGWGLSAHAASGKAPAASGKAPAASREAAEKPGAALRAIVASGRLPTLRWPNFPDYRHQVESLYRRSGYKTVWVHGGQPTAQAGEMISILQHADSKGLLPEDYDAASWTGRLARLRANHTPVEEARFDVALTVCTMRYASDVREGRVNPSRVEFRLGAESRQLDLSGFVEKRLLKGTDLTAALAGIEPASSEYHGLLKALRSTCAWPRRTAERNSPILTA